MHVEQALLWVTAAIGFYMAWNIGANDVANAFGTSVGSGSLTLRRALVLAAIFEFCGAYFVGSNVADTIKGGIVQQEIFAGNPRLFEIGMLSALLGASLWLHLATYLKQPVSTTHAIIGAVIGFGLVCAGTHSVHWQKLGRIAASWVVSPVVGGVLAFLLYRAILRWILHAKEPLDRARWAVPIGFGALVLVVAFSILRQLYQRIPQVSWVKELATFALPMALILGIGSLSLLRHGMVRRHRKRGSPLAGRGTSDKIEQWFGRLQIGTACYMAFAHGANDVANAIGPIAGVVQALRGEIAHKALVPAWILAFGGIGIVLGLATYGHKVMAAVGKEITEVTPTRGFAAAFGTATTVLLCSMLGLPISTTFVLVGAVMGVGLARGFAAIDLRVVRRIFASWLVTIPVSAVLAAGISWLLMHTLLLAP